LIRKARQLPEIKAIAAADVWDERGEDRLERRDEAADLASSTGER
jgi:hypothetical protein